MYVFIDKISTEKESGRIYLVYRVWLTQADFDSGLPAVYSNDHLIDTARLSESDIRFIRDGNGNYVSLEGKPITVAEYVDEVIAYHAGKRETHPSDDLQTESFKLNLDETIKAIIKNNLDTVVLAEKLSGDSRSTFEDKVPSPGDKAEHPELKSILHIGFEVAVARRIR
jgi:hypothetical protein